KAVMDAKAVLDLDRRSREGVVGGRGRENDKVDVFRLQPCVLDRRACSCLAERDSGFVVTRHMALLATRTLDNPHVRRVNKLLEILVGHDTARQGGTDADKNGPNHQIHLCTGYFADSQRCWLARVIKIERRAGLLENTALHQLIAQLDGSSKSFRIRPP